MKEGHGIGLQQALQLALQWIAPAQAWKATEVCIGGVNFGAVLNCNSCKVGVRREVASNPCADQQALKQLKMAWSWLEDYDVGPC